MKKALLSEAKGSKSGGDKPRRGASNKGDGKGGKPEGAAPRKRKAKQ